MPLKKRPFRGPRSLTAKVNSLSRTVAQNKNEKQYFIKSTNLSGVAGLNVNTLSCITDQFTDSQFPFTVSGDKWNLHSLRLQGLSARTIVYFPKKAGERFTPTTFNQIPDPKQFTILMDHTLNQPSARTASWDYKSARDIRLNRTVLINRNGAGVGSTVERGDLVICHINKDAIGDIDVNPASYRLTFTDK